MAGNTPLGRMLIDIDLDTTKLGSSTTHLQRQMRIVNSAMRANLAGLKDNSKETDVLGVKIDGLNKKQKIQAGIVEQTEKRYQELVKTKGAGAKETEAYANTLNREQAKLREVTNELKEMERQQKIVNSNWTKLGNSLNTAGSGLTTFGNGMKQVGGGLTRYITAPVLGAITAAGGLTAAFGWKRLVGIDNAKAQLKGLGYSTEEVGEISEEVSNAINGGMMTMAEGTSVAAGALAAGVEQGAELEKYIKLVDAAAVGANKPVADMAMIFNRVQGSGKLMTEELNMIEDGMPGFSQAMSDHMGVSMEEFRKMVTEGQVSSDDFLTVMDGFAGGMADAYSETWSGMLSNTKANIGKIGENLLSGVFEQSKDSIREFLDLLRSDTVKTWSIAAGETIGQVFTNIVDKVRTGVEWFTNLSNENKKLIGIFTAVAVSAGPLLMAFGTMAGWLGNIFTALSPVMLAVGKAGGLFKLLGLAVGGLFTPVGLAVGIIAAIGVGLVVAYKKSETFRNAVQNLGERFKESFNLIRDKATEVWEKIKVFGDGIKQLFQGDDASAQKILKELGITPENITKLEGFRDNIIELKDKIIETAKNIADRIEPAMQAVSDFVSETGATIKRIWEENSSSIIPVVTNIGNFISDTFKFILDTINFIMPAVEFVIKMVWDNIKGIIDGGLKIIEGLIKVFSGLFTGDFSKMWEGVKDIFFGAIEFVWNLIQLSFYGRIIKGVGALVKGFGGLIKGLWTTVKNFFTGLADDAVLRVMYMKDAVVKFITNMATGARTKVKEMVDKVVNFFKGLAETVALRVMYMKDKVVSLITKMATGVRTKVKELVDRVKKFFVDMYTNTTTRVNNLRTKVSDTFSNLRTRVTDTVKNLINRVKDFFVNMYTSVTTRVGNLRTRASEIFNNLRTRVVNTVKNLIDRVKSFFSDMYNRVRNIVSNLRTNVVNGFNTIRDRVVGAATRMKDKAVDMFNTMKNKAKEKLDDLVTGAKELPGKIKDAIVKGKNKAVDGIKELGNSMASKLESVINGMIGGLNKILSKLGIDGIGEITVKRFSTGTGAPSSATRNGAVAQDMLATVGDRGRGNGSGTRELVQYPNGTTGLYDNDATIFAPKGTIIYNNKQTEDIIAQASMPKFSTGTMGAGSGTKGASKKDKGLFGTMKDVLANTWDYIKNPKKAFDAVIANVGAKFDNLSGFANKLTKGGFNYVKDKAFDWMKGIFKNNEGGEVNGGSILNRGITARFGNYPANIARQLGVTRHYGLDTAHRYEPLTSPVSGKVTKVWHDTYGGNAIQINAGDLDWWFMHMKSISRKVGDIVKAGKTNLGVTGNTGLRTTGYHLHTQAMRGGIGNGYAIDPLPILKKAGFATGGLVNNGIYALGEEGHPEWVIPTDPKRRTDAMKLLAHAGKSLQKNNGNLRPNNLPNIPTSNNSNNDIDKLTEMVANQQTMIELMAKFVEKEFVALYNEKHLARDIEPEVSKRQEFKNSRGTRLA